MSESIIRCPKCLWPAEPVKDFAPGQENLFYDCPRCSIRFKMWGYNQGDDWKFLDFVRGYKK